MQWLYVYACSKAEDVMAAILRRTSRLNLLNSCKPLAKPHKSWYRASAFRGGHGGSLSIKPNSVGASDVSANLVICSLVVEFFAESSTKHRLTGSSRLFLVRQYNFSLHRRTPGQTMVR